MARTQITDEQLDALRTQAEAKIVASPRLRKHRELLMGPNESGQQSEEDGLQWIINTPVREILEWVADCNR